MRYHLTSLFANKFFIILEIEEYLNHWPNRASGSNKSISHENKQVKLPDLSLDLRA